MRLALFCTKKALIWLIALSLLAIVLMMLHIASSPFVNHDQPESASVSFRAPQRDGVAEFGLAGLPRDDVGTAPSQFVPEDIDDVPVGGGIAVQSAPASSSVSSHELQKMVSMLMESPTRSRDGSSSIQPADHLSQLPFFQLSTIFRTSVIREKPRACFLVWDQNQKAVASSPVRTTVGGDGKFNTTLINTMLHTIAATSPERIPPLAYCHDDYMAHHGEPIPRSFPTYTTGFIFDGERCSTNMWHGLLEVVVPVFGAKVLVALRQLGFSLSSVATLTDASRLKRMALLTPQLADRVVELLLKQQQQGQHVLFLRAPRKNIWGVHNLGCPILNHYPYGWSEKSVSGWILKSLFDGIGFDKKGWPIVENAVSSGGRGAKPQQSHESSIYFFQESPSSSKKYEMRLFGKSATVGVSESIFYGPSSLCRWNRPFDMPPRLVPPYYLHADPLCPWVYDVMRRYTLSVASIEDTPVTAASLQCPTVGFVTRRSYHNGRGIRNLGSLLSALATHIMDGGRGGTAFKKGCGTLRVLSLEGDVPFREQLLRVNSVDILIGARGMGLTNAAFMKRNAGLMILSGREVGSKLNVASDNYPWHPLHALRSWNPSVLSSCPVVFPSNDFLKKAASTAAAVAGSNETVAPGVNSTAAEVATYARRCIGRSINFCDIVCDIRKFLYDFDALFAMVGSAVARGGESPQGSATNVSAFIRITDSWV